MALSHELKARGVDMIDCPSGGIPGESDMPPLPRAGLSLPAARIKQEVGIPTIAVGLITDAGQAEAILQEEKADIAALARELCGTAIGRCMPPATWGRPVCFAKLEYAHRLEIANGPKPCPSPGRRRNRRRFRRLGGAGRAAVSAA